MQRTTVRGFDFTSAPIRKKPFGSSTGELYRVNFEVSNLKLVVTLAFPLLLFRETALKQASFGDESVTSIPARIEQNSFGPTSGLLTIRRLESECRVKED
jgi:hypothetical protein